MNARQLASCLLTLASCLSGCQYGPEPVPPPPVPTQDQCPEGFAPLASDLAAGGGLEDGCYAVLRSADWMAGEDACEEFESEGVLAHLVVVDREAEHEVLSEISLGGVGVWIGRLQRDPDDAYRNINYVEWDTEYFARGEPNDYTEDCDFLGSCYPAPGEGDERCIEYSHETGLWNDEECFDAQTVVCEWDGVAPLGWRPYRADD